MESCFQQREHFKIFNLKRLSIIFDPSSNLDNLLNRLSLLN